ncbi:MAG: glycoside hydrolase family protein [Clostridia bacterium]|nr:glycoside hydrolase family protein [Clostridia bacterium]
MRFYDRLQPAPTTAIFSEDGYFVWCGSLIKHGDTYYLFYSRWKKEYGFDAWVTHSEIAVATSKTLFGEFRFEKVILTRSEAPSWDRDCFHNPCVIEQNGVFYLYYMGNYGDGSYWDHRNHQRIGVAYASHPLGAWTRSPAPVIDVSPHGFDCLMTSNPSVCRFPDGRIALLYKGVGKEGSLPKGGPVVCSMAYAKDPMGPFEKTGIPVMQNPEHPWSVEDPCLFYEQGRLWAIAKDFHGYFTGTGSTSLALFVSTDGVGFVPAEEPLAMPLVLPMETGTLAVKRLERPQPYFEDGELKAILLAVMPYPEGDTLHSYSIRVPVQPTQETE